MSAAAFVWIVWTGTAVGFFFAGRLYELHRIRNEQRRAATSGVSRG